MSALTDAEQVEFERATCCRNCMADFTNQNPKTRDHSHVTGSYLFQACCNCNLALKPRKRRAGRGDNDDDDDYLVPIEYTTKSGKTAYADVGKIPMNGERNLLLSIGNIGFVDSMQFLAASLDNLVKEMRNSGLDDFTHMTRHFGRTLKLFFKKGSYPYEYMTNITKFNEITPPPKSAFYSRLCNEHTSYKEYERAQQIWSLQSMNMLHAWHDFYLTLDVLLLSDVFEKFRWTRLNSDGLELSTFSQPSEHDTAVGAESDRRQDGIDFKPEHLSHERVRDTRRTELCLAAPRKSEFPRHARLPSRPAHFASALP